MGETVSFELLWGADEIARYLNLRPRQVYRMLNDGLLPAKQTGRQWVVSKRVLRDFFGAEEREAKLPQTPSEPEPTVDEPSRPDWTTMKLRLPPEMHAHVKARSTELGMSMNQYILQILDNDRADADAFTAASEEELLRGIESLATSTLPPPDGLPDNVARLPKPDPISDATMVLRNALRERLVEATVIGTDRDGRTYYCSSLDTRDALWDMERVKLDMLRGPSASGAEPA